MNGRTAAFNFYFSGTSNSSISIGDTFALSSGDTVVLSGTPVVGMYHLIDYRHLTRAADLRTWTISGPGGFHYSLIYDRANSCIDLHITARRKRGA